MSSVFYRFFDSYPGEEPRPTLISELIWLLAPQMVCREGGKYLFAFAGGDRDLKPVGLLLFQRPRFVPFYRHPVVDGYLDVRFMGLPEAFLSYIEHRILELAYNPVSLADLFSRPGGHDLTAGAILAMRPVGVLSTLTARERYDLVVAEIKRLASGKDLPAGLVSLAGRQAKAGTLAAFVAYLELLYGLVTGQMVDICTTALAAGLDAENPAKHVEKVALRLLAAAGMLASGLQGAGNVPAQLDLGVDVQAGPGFATEEKLQPSRKKRQSSSKSRKTV